MATTFIAIFGLVLLQGGESAVAEIPWVDVSFVDGRCTFMTTDIEYNAAQLTDDLRENPVKDQIDLAVQPNTPDRCVRIARRAALRADFKTVGLRPYQDVPPNCIPMPCEPAYAVGHGSEKDEAPRR